LYPLAPHADLTNRQYKPRNCRDLGRETRMAISGWPFHLTCDGMMRYHNSSSFQVNKKQYSKLQIYIVVHVVLTTTGCLSFVAGLRGAIRDLHFADRRQSQLPTLQAYL